jgi:hypothetical protein
MQLEWDEHFSEIVIPTWQEYLGAEHELTATARAPDEAASKRATYTALRKGASAVLILHHFADVIARARPHFIPAAAHGVGPVQEWLTGYCTSLRTNKQVADVSLLGDVADALKHAVLTRRLDIREVASNDAVLVVATGFAELPYGEGKFGGADQVIVRASSGPRALSAVLQNVIDAWRRAVGLKLPEIGHA